MVVVWLGPKTAMMSLNDRAADGQPDTHATAFGGVEGLEEPPPVLRTDADAGILHAETYAIVFFPPGSDHQLPRAILNTDHRVRSIAEQVQRNLLQLDTVSDYAGDILG